MFIADLHLVPNNPKTLDLALRFLTQAQRYDHLYILGDLFEYWLGDDAGVVAYEPVIDALKSLQTHRCKLTIMLGNRDFLLGEQFAEASQANLITADEHLIELDGKPVLLMHGDTLCTGDTDYLQFRSMVRDSQWQSEFLAQSIEERLTVADSLRKTSKEANSQKTKRIMDVSDDAVAERLTAHQCASLIHGHTHRPAIHEIDDYHKRYVVGDWQIDHAQYIEWSPNSFELKTFR